VLEASGAYWCGLTLATAPRRQGGGRLAIESKDSDA
jgi:hypothetical protein